MTPHELPLSLTVDGVTYKYFSPMHECTPGNLYVYQAYLEDESPILLLTKGEALNIAGGMPYDPFKYTWADKSFDLLDLRVNHHNQEWATVHLKHALRAVAESVPHTLLIKEKIYMLEPDKFQPFENTHCYTHHHEDVRLHSLFLSDDEVDGYLMEMLSTIDYTRQIKSSRFGGYECSSNGDKRFSAFHAWMPDGRTIEHWYQCGTLDGRGKGFQPGGRDWRLGKGKIPLNPKDKEVQWQEYYGFWAEWAKLHPNWMSELHWHASRNDYNLSDQFAGSPINQARALAELLNQTNS